MAASVKIGHTLKFIGTLLEQMNFKFPLMFTSKHLALIALVLWINSLALTGLAVYAQDHNLDGYEILLTGWLSPLVGNFAWFANIFFLYALYRAFAGKSLLIPSIIAVILSLDTLRFSELLLNEGGSTSPIYGYGWGAALWFFSIFLLLAVAGTRQSELWVKEDQEHGYLWIRYLTFIPFVIVTVLFTYWSVSDRSIANQEELNNLSGLAFKRGGVCGVEIPEINKVASKLNGPLEIILGDKFAHSNYPFKQTKTLLEWGIPAIRMNGSDYSLKNGEIQSVPANGDAPAALHVIENPSHKGRGGNIRVKLVLEANKEVIFDQTWERQPYDINTYIYCPTYKSFPNVEDQPRKILLEALNITGRAVVGKKAIKRPTFDELAVYSTVLNTSEGGETYNEEMERLNIEIPDQNRRLIFHKTFNADCPLGTGWDGQASDSGQNVGWPFMIKGKAYYPGRQKSYYSLCVSDHAYLYDGYASNGKYFIKMQKRSLVNFEEKWRHIIVLPKTLVAKRNKEYKVKSIIESDNIVKLELVNRFTGKIIDLQVGLE